MPNWFWIIIAVLFGIGGIIVLFKLATSKDGGLKIAGHEIRFSSSSGVPGSSGTHGCNDEQNEILRLNEWTLGEVFQEMNELVLAHMHKDLGIPKDSLSNNNDYIFCRSLIWQVVYGKNGRHSIRTIIEDIIIFEDYKIPSGPTPEIQIEKRRDKMKTIVNNINNEIQKLFEDKYDNLFTLPDPETKKPIEMKRIVTREKLAEIFKLYSNDQLATHIEALLFSRNE